MRQTREALRVVFEVENAMADFERRLAAIHPTYDLKNTLALRNYVREFSQIGTTIRRAGDDLIRAVSEAELKEKDKQAAGIGYHLQTS